MSRPCRTEGNIPTILRIFDSMNSKCAVTLIAALLCMSSSAVAADDIEGKAKVCATCHGADGIPQLKMTPVIWGQNAGYLFLQLRNAVGPM
ncbi:MAG TPA: hypothetical protein VJK06_08890, partial [Methyloceanibacter sp.]|nr:hypothetical protein [Methyloceanibacter sp.]